MSWHALMLLVPLVVSCAASSSEMLAEGGGDGDSGSGAYEMSREEFESIERLKDDPVDPRKAGIEELLSIPDFSRELADAVIRARGERRPGTSWLDHLSPPERESIYRHAGYLILPARKATRYKVRVNAAGVGAAEHARYDGYSSLLGDGFKILLRARMAGERHYSSFYASKRLFSGSVRLHGGDFMPDFAMGLAFSSYHNDYPFSGGYPLRGYRWMAARTSFYGTSLRGCAGEVWKGSLRTLFFAGRPRSFSTGGCALDARLVSGGRIEIDLGFCSIGSTAYHDPRRGSLASFDGRCKAGLIAGGFEFIAGARRNAVTASVSYNARRIDAGIILHSFPGYLPNRFGASPHSEGGARRAGRGIGLVASRSFGRSLTVRGAYDRYIRYSGGGSLLRDVLRAGIARKCRGFNLEVYLTSKRYGSRVEIPYPAQGVQSVKTAHTLKTNMMYHRGATFRFKVAGGYIRGNGYAGYQISPSVYLGSLAGHVSIIAFFTAYHSLAGKAVFYYYEPSPKGSYPWRTVRGDGCRGVLSISLTARKFFFAWRSAIEPKSPVETSLCVGLKL